MEKKRSIKRSTKGLNPWIPIIEIHNLTAEQIMERQTKQGGNNKGWFARANHSRRHINIDRPIFPGERQSQIAS